MRFGIYHGAASRYAGDIAHRFERIQVENSEMTHRAGAGGVQTASFGVGKNIVKVAFPTNFGCQLPGKLIA